MKNISIYTILLVFLLASCGGNKKTVTGSKKTETTKPTQNTSANEISNNTSTTENKDYDIVKYISHYRNIAKKEMKEYGIPSSIILAQGILESQAGKSRLATEGNNHFGIKCHKDWHGKTIVHDDDEDQECFRKYNDATQSFKDHSKFLAFRKRYAFLFRLPKTDYEAWARGLKKAGYATDPSYPEKLIYIIEKYRLATIDKEVLENMNVKVEEVENTSNKKKKFIYEVKEGETIFTIAQKFGIPVKDIQRKNNLNEFDIYEGQILVLTEPSNENNSINKPVETTPVVKEPVTEEPVVTSETPTTVEDTLETPTEVKNIKLHTVGQGETLFSISKLYNIDIEDIKQANQLSGNSIDIGYTLKLPMDKVKKTVTAPIVEEPIEATQPEPDATSTQEEDKYHIVQPGETLYRIHINYNISVSTLRKINHLKGNYIKVGQKLRVK